MNRREVLEMLGATAAGLAGGVPVPQNAGAAEHPDRTPANQFHLYLCAFHLAKKDPRFVVEAHHYCSMLNEDVHQCVVFDSPGKNARLLGVEYIISDSLYRKLPDSEKRYWHSHTYEVIAGLLIAPDLPKAAEKELMDKVLVTWGKTWHTWPDPKTPLPEGEPLLMWAATKDGQIPQEVLTDRDKRFQVSTPEIRKRRAYLGPVPQIDPPRSVDEIGRQWSNEGPDEPKRKK
ncbi:MAG: OBAP family protein [Gemmataceae bacterium]|nr:OBAP family protein [Gemmataceae bacterium]